MVTSVENLRAERRRKLQVRESFSRSLDHFRTGGADPLPFYLCCGDFLAAGQRRLIDQDRRLVDILEPRVPAEQEDDHQAIAALRERLALADRSLADFQQALDELHRRGGAARSEFEQAAARFLDFSIKVLGARSHSLRHLTTTLLNEDDWQRIVDVTPEFMKTEAAGLAAINRLAPQGLRPDQMKTEAPPR